MRAPAQLALPRSGERTYVHPIRASPSPACAPSSAGLFQQSGAAVAGRCRALQASTRHALAQLFQVSDNNLCRHRSRAALLRRLGAALLARPRHSARQRRQDRPAATRLVPSRVVACDDPAACRAECLRACKQRGAEAAQQRGPAFDADQRVVVAYLKQLRESDVSMAWSARPSTCDGRAGLLEKSPRSKAAQAGDGEALGSGERMSLSASR